MSDDRFSALSSDPRYRLPSRKEARTAVDPRFKRLFTDQDFRKKASVDRYGRKLKPESGKKELERLYRLDKDERPNDKVKKQAKVSEREVVGSSDESESEESEEDEQLVTKKDPAREGGFSESSSEEETASEEETDLDDEDELAEATAGQEQTEEIPMGEVTNRIACVNLDWDNIRAADIMAVAASFAPADGRVESVVVYPSEFGRERMEREELEGPPREIFASSKRANGANEDDDESDEDEDGDEDDKIERELQQAQVSEGAEFDTAALRQYQIERLRYFYAVITCSSDSCAKRIYDALDGHEYLNTANFFDLRFIPDEVTFDDDKPREECSKLPEGYRPNEFRTEALTHSKVRLTWDDDDPERKEVQKRAFSRAEIDENDMQAYIGSDSSDAESVTSKKSAAEDRKARTKEAERAKMRAALGLGDEPSRSKKTNDEPVGDMQITFTSGMTNGGDKGEVFENEPQDKESTRDRYIRKERERKQKRKERAKAARHNDADAGAEQSASDVDPQAEATVAGEDDLGFDDPFFNDPEAASKAEKKAKKADRARQKAAAAAQDSAASRKQRAELDLLMADDQADADGVRHFDMREIEKAEKEARRKGKKGRKGKDKGKGVDEDGKREDDFAVETEDPRFKALFESHEFAIDPTNPRFKRTKGMEQLREEGRKRKRVDGEEGEEGEGGKGERGARKARKEKGGRDDELKGLVSRLGGGKKVKR